MTAEGQLRDFCGVDSPVKAAQKGSNVRDRTSVELSKKATQRRFNRLVVPRAPLKTVGRQAKIGLLDIVVLRFRL